MIASEAEIPEKLYFKIGEVARIIGVEPYVLRYWETEFSMVRPGKTRARHRLYRRRDVETLLQIKRLLHDERYTIEGAKRQLKLPSRASETEPESPTDAVRETLSRLKHELRELRALLTARTLP